MAIRSCFILLCIILIGACKDQQNSDEAFIDDKLLVEVFEHKLHESDLAGLYPMNASSSDSSQFRVVFSERWLRDKLVLHEAEQHIPEDLDIDKLVHNYRSSLIRHSYEQQLVAELMDTSVSEQELTEYYEKNKEQYQLETPIIRCLFIKGEETDFDLNKLNKLWRSNDEDDKAELLRYCEANADMYLLDDDVWYSLEEISSLFPFEVLTINNFRQKQRLNFKYLEDRYLFRIIEIISKKETAPLSFIYERAKRVVLHQKELKFLEELKESLYDKEINGNNIKTYFE